jgi:8-oxo-dGTP pyrophosphatase MutT (NUDIX family)
MSRRKGEVMNNLLQVPCGKVDPDDETAEDAAQREVNEETGIWIEQEDLIYIGNDSEFDCDMFVAKTLRVPSQTEPEKAGPWYFYTWDQFKVQARYLLTTPSLTKYMDKIVQIGRQ